MSDEVDGSALAVVKCLLQKSYLSQARGRILYTDNWYTTFDLAKWLFDALGWRFCGTLTPTEKKSHQDLDVPFHKLSKGAMDSIECGWFCKAAVKQETKTGKTFYIQNSTWKDRKQVMFLHTTDIGTSKSHSVNLSTKGPCGQSTLQAPLCQANYVKHFHASREGNTGLLLPWKGRYGKRELR